MTEKLSQRLSQQQISSWAPDGIHHNFRHRICQVWGNLRPQSIQIIQTLWTMQRSQRSNSSQHCFFCNSSTWQGWKMLFFVWFMSFSGLNLRGLERSITPDEAPRPQGPRSSGKFWPHTPTSRALLADHRCGSAEGSTMKNCGQIDSKRLRISMDFYGFVTFTRLGIVVSGTHGSRVSLPDGNVHPRSNSIIGWTLQVESIGLNVKSKTGRKTITTVLTLFPLHCTWSFAFVVLVCLGEIDTWTADNVSRALKVSRNLTVSSRAISKPCQGGSNCQSSMLGTQLAVSGSRICPCHASAMSRGWRPSAKLCSANFMSSPINITLVAWHQRFAGKEWGRNGKPQLPWHGNGKPHSQSDFCA